ncbi:MAG: serpin family protein [Planctomycetaceae bacterium]
MNAHRTRRITLVSAAGLLLAGVFAALPDCAHRLEAQQPRPVPRDVGAPRPAQPPLSDDLKSVVRGNNRFAFELYRKLRETETGNLFYSPYSISTALAMTHAGAKGETATQMARTLRFDLPEEKLHAAYRELASRLRPEAAQGESPAYILTVANRLWGQQGYDFLPEYLKLTREQYGAELAQLDFAQSEQARMTINDWVATHTERKIENLIPGGALDDMTRLVLTNAIYFKGDWAKPFEKRATQAADFHVTSDKTTKAPLMHKSDNLPYADLGDAQLLELPYAKNGVSMLVLLPKNVDGLDALEAKLTAENFADWTAKSRRREVQVFLPRFELTEEFQLNGMLSALGMKDAFVPDQADFSGMNGRRDLYITAVVHKAFVDVNEEGTEAAAATGVIVGVTSAPAEPTVFRADRPFVFVIRDNATGSVLFVGRVREPKG